MSDPHEAFLQRYLSCQEDLRAYLLALVRDAGRADELLQETALVLWRRWGDYDGTRPFGAWARGVARNVTLRDHERRRRLVLLDEAALDAVDRAFAAGAEPDDGSELLAALRACVRELPAPARRLLEQRYDAQRPIDQIARAMRRSVFAVTKQLSRLRASLQRCVERRLEREGAS